MDLAGPNAPAGAATITRLTSAAITDSNEDASVVNIETTQQAAFDPRQAMTLPPFSLTVIISDAPAIPTDVQATAQSAGQVAVGWDASFGAARYEVQRRTGTHPFQLVASSTGASYIDAAVSPGSAYLYRVRAVGSDDTPSAFARRPGADRLDGPSLAHSFAALGLPAPSFARPITAGTTTIQAGEWQELRAIVR